MALNDEVIIIALGILFNYLVIYRKHKILGGMIFLAISIGITYYSVAGIINLVSILMMIGSIAILVYDILDFKIPTAKGSSVRKMFK